MRSSYSRRFILSVLFISAGTMLFASVGIAQTRTIQNVSPRAHGAPVGSSIADIAMSIEKAGQELGWNPVAQGDGFLDLVTFVRAKHEATVRVGFDDSNFWIDYLGSVNLKYSANDLVRGRGGASRAAVKGPRIHGNYNKWVKILAIRIAERVSSPCFQARTARPQASTLLVADELEKLDALRQRGVLTEDEFDRQKERLLSN